MTKTQKLIEEVREKMGDVTNYQIAKTLGFHRSAMKRMTEGNQQADAYACTRIALLIGRDPLEVIAEVEAESATTEAKRSFWASFRSGLVHTTCGGVLLLTGSFLAPGQTGMANADDGAGSGTVRIMGSLVQHLRRRFNKMQKARESGFFFGCLHRSNP